MSTLWHGDLSDATILAKLKRLARIDRIVITTHAGKRMEERGVTERDIRKALLTATAAVYQDDRET